MSGEDFLNVLLLYAMLRGAVAIPFDVRALVRGVRNLRRWGTWSGRQW